MRTFLEYVAQDIITKYGTDLSRIAVVFPNKRASLFMNEYLARIADKPIWSPAYITISELFRQHCSLMIGDPIKLICDLYQTFIQCTGSDESLDHFYGWGQLLLSDFDDIDKNLADAEKIFLNLRDIHEFDDVSYLSDEQKEILKKFFSNFSDDHSSELKRRFLDLWSHFGDIYRDFNKRLEAQGLTYEGALYRKVVADETAVFNHETYIFVGFNALQRVEQSLFIRLRKAKKAKFYWDFDEYYMSNTAPNEAGYFIRQYLSAFPNELDRSDQEIYANLEKTKDITYISATTENIQARYISKWLREQDRIAADRRTAIVLCDESLLQTVTHCLPPEVTRVNVTMGYPLSQSPISSLINLLITLQTAGHSAGSDRYRLHDVNAVLQHPYARYLSPKYVELLNELNCHKRYFPNRSELALDEGLSLLFSEISSESVSDQNLKLSQWILRLLKHIGQNAKDEIDPLFQESLFRMYTLMNRLSDLIEAGDLVVDLITYQRLIGQLVRSTSIPFHGEPAVGIQIMGILETRNLDFDHVLVLSCNEGNMPKGINDSSFIPYSIRKAFDLTTIDHKMALYAYYFHSLVQRAEDITMLYNSATDDGHTGEMSRFMLQLMVESGHHIKREALQAGQIPLVLQPKPIAKSAEVMNILYDFDKISPTAINRYIRCQLLFYYNCVAGIKEPDEENEDLIDNRMFGNIFHKASELVYNRFMNRNYMIHAADIDEILKHSEQIDSIVDQAFREELFKVDREGFRPEYNGLQLINREVIISYLRQLLEADRRLAPFSIKALEQDVYTTINFNSNNKEISLQMGGFIDRMDYIDQPPEGPRIRVIDYKTGGSPSSTTATIEEIFEGKSIRTKHTDYYLQAILYSLIVKRSPAWNPEALPVSPALLFIQHTKGEDYDPTLLFGKEKIIDADRYREEFETQLKALLSEIYDPNLAFMPAADKEQCAGCRYKRLCWS